MTDTPTTIIFVKPNQGARVRQPNRGYRVMPDTGDFVHVDDSFYLRLIASGDLIVSDHPVEVKSEESVSVKSKSR